MKTLKVLSLSLLVLALSIGSAQAQFKGDKAVGANLAFGMGDNYSNIGLGIKALYNITDPIRLEGAFTYFLKKDYVSMMDFSVYGHYLFPVTDKFIVYPLAGLGYYNSIVDLGGLGNTTYGDFALTLGGGIDYKLSSNLVLQADLKYKIVDYSNRFIISAGVAFQF